MSYHVVTTGPSVARIVDPRGNASPLPKPRTGGFRARCTCGWRSAEVGTLAEAEKLRGAHVRDTERRKQP